MGLSTVPVMERRELEEDNGEARLAIGKCIQQSSLILKAHMGRRIHFGFGNPFMAFLLSLAICLCPKNHQSQLLSTQLC